MNARVVEWKIDRSIPSDPAVACELILTTIHHMERLGWNEADVFAVHMALEESIMNAIKHGNRRDPAKQIKLIIQIFSDRFEAVIRDEGCGFCLASVPDPTADENLEKSSGRGVMLIRQFMDDVEYQDGGCQIQIRKNRS